MTVIVDVAFPLGYIHATPWGSHVNEGAVEYPPSPWRLLRGLVATWHTRCPDIPADDARDALAQLAAPPSVRTSVRTEASIRTYLPSEGDRSGLDKPRVDLMVDAFAAVPRRSPAVSYRWDADPPAATRAAIDRLVDGLPYLGRAESVCRATTHYADDGRGRWLAPRPDADGVGRRTLVPSLPLDVDALSARISDLRRRGRLWPPGSQWVRYDVDGPLERLRAAAAPKRRSVRAVRFALSGNAPMSVRQTVVVADAMRSAAMSRYGAMFNGTTTQVFAGKDDAGVPRRGNEHAHWLPVDLDGDRLLDTIIVWAPSGFDEGAMQALASIRELRFHGGDGAGTARQLFVGLEASVDRDLGALRADRVTGVARKWRSATPFLPQRHRKREDVDAWLADCVARELRAREHDVPVRLRRERSTNWGAFRRYRRAERLERARPGFGLELEFDEPVAGPITIGQLAHFGMGRFEVC